MTKKSFFENPNKISYECLSSNLFTCFNFVFNQHKKVIFSSFKCFLDLSLILCLIFSESLLRHTEHNGFPVVVSQESQYLVGFVLRRDLNLAIGQSSCSISRHCSVQLQYHQQLVSLVVLHCDIGQSSITLSHWLVYLQCLYKMVNLRVVTLAFGPSS